MSVTFVFWRDTLNPPMRNLLLHFKATLNALEHFVIEICSHDCAHDPPTYAKIGLNNPFPKRPRIRNAWGKMWERLINEYI